MSHTTPVFSIVSTMITIFGALFLLGCSSSDVGEMDTRDGFDSPQAAIEAGVGAMIELDPGKLYAALPPQSERHEADEFVAQLDGEEMAQVGNVTVTNVQTNDEETLAAAQVRILSQGGEVIGDVRMGAIRVEQRWYFGGPVPHGR